MSLLLLTEAVLLRVFDPEWPEWLKPLQATVKILPAGNRLKTVHGVGSQKRGRQPRTRSVRADINVLDSSASRCMGWSPSIRSWRPRHALVPRVGLPLVTCTFRAYALSSWQAQAPARRHRVRAGDVARIATRNLSSLL